ncbi:hypothetical protein FHR75_001885 [Kineococcus radiotolerans]|uniref:DUF4194 domain-containing protein n=1 Tax=Kineococcus radiotolerans TaxID=131568 RepID=A0A7W4XX38_KINRA|nr:DUF4194 domain-containing protein [Kineococcus radiotolerans]MBB2901097.1 hypothetical protein [Kineococcus radiotolerans]
MSTPDERTDGDDLDAADALDPASAGEDPAALDEEGLFTGDTGTLPRAVRTVLVQLLKRRYLSAERHPRSWRVLVENQRALRSRLNDVFLDLVVDQDHQVAYKQQAVSRTGQQRFPTLLHDQPWSREETALLICLRRLARSRSASGEGAVFVDREELLQEVAHFRPLDSTNHVRDEQSAAAGVDSLVRQEVLLETGTENRYRVSPILEVLLPVDVVQRIAARLGAGAPAGDVAGDVVGEPA